MSDAPRVLMLFAAGKGTRMAPLTDHTPKPLIKVGRQSLLDRALDLAHEAGVTRTVVNTHYLGGQIVTHLQAPAFQSRDIAISDESEALLETGGGLKKALPLLGPAPVITLNPDVVWTGANPVAELRAAWDPDRMDALLALVPLRAAHGRLGGGDFSMDREGRLTRKGSLIYGGAQIIKTERLAEITDPAFSLNRLWDLMLADGRAYGMVHQGEWCDVGRPDSISKAEELLYG